MFTIVVVLAVWLVLGGFSALVLSRTVRVRDDRSVRPLSPGGSLFPVAGGSVDAGMVAPVA